MPPLTSEGWEKLFQLAGSEPVSYAKDAVARASRATSGPTAAASHRRACTTRRPHRSCRTERRMSSSTGCSRARCLSPPPSTAPAAARGRRLLTIGLGLPTVRYGWRRATRASARAAPPWRTPLPNLHPHPSSHPSDLPRPGPSSHLTLSPPSPTLSTMFLPPSPPGQHPLSGRHLRRDELP